MTPFSFTLANFFRGDRWGPPIFSVGTAGDRQNFPWGPVGTANFFCGDRWGPPLFFVGIGGDRHTFSTTQDVVMHVNCLMLVTFAVCNVCIVALCFHRCLSNKMTCAPSWLQLYHCFFCSKQLYIRKAKRTTNSKFWKCQASIHGNQ